MPPVLRTNQNWAISLLFNNHNIKKSVIKWVYLKNEMCLHPIVLMTWFGSGSGFLFYNLFEVFIDYNFFSKTFSCKQWRSVYSYNIYLLSHYYLLQNKIKFNFKNFEIVKPPPIIINIENTPLRVSSCVYFYLTIHFFLFKIIISN